MLRPVSWAVAAVVAIAVAALFYLLPTLVEIHFLPRLGMLGTIAVGNCIGCAVLAIFDWKKALLLLVTLDVAEGLAAISGLASLRYLVTLTDLVPATVLAILAARFAVDTLLVLDTPESNS